MNVKYSIPASSVVNTNGTANLTGYPVDLSLFLDMSRVYLAPEDSSSASLPESGNPVAIAQSALALWNGYVASAEEKSRETFLEAARWLVKHALRVGDDAMGWPLTYSHPLYLTRGSWLSSVAQGCGLSVLVRAYQLSGDGHFLETAHRVAHTFERDILDGGVCTPIGADGIFFEEVAVYPAAHTLHGCIFALIGLYDYAAIVENPHIWHFIQRGEVALHGLFDEFDLGFWTRADLLQRGLSTPVQLAQQTTLLRALAFCRGCPHCAEHASRWRHYQRGSFSCLRYAFAHRKARLKQALLRCVRAVIVSRSPAANPQTALYLRVCVPVANHPYPGGIGTFLDRIARIMADSWQMEYVTQRIGSDVGDRVMHGFGRAWMIPWYFPQVWLYVLAGAHKLLSLMHQGASYDLIIPQDGVYSGALAAFIGRLTGVRVVCFDHSNLTYYKNRAYHSERLRALDEKAWPRLFRQLAKTLLAFYWPSLRAFARLATAQADHLLCPGVPGDEVDEICRELHVLPSRVTRFNVAVDMQRHWDLSAQEKAARRASLGIPTDALVIAITVRLEMEKGLDISLESISRALSSLAPAVRDRVRVMIAGEGELRQWLEQEIRLRGLSHVCRMLGNIPSEGVHSLLAASDISLHTSVRGVCMPAAVLEGMAAGCAVIASTEPLANVQVLAEGRGIVVPAGDVEQTSQALEYLLRDADLRNRMGKAAREYIALRHGTETLRRALLQEPCWSDVEKPLKIQTEPLETVEKAKRSREMHEPGTGMIGETMPLLTETKHNCNTTADLTDAARIDEVPTLGLPAVDVDQLPTQVGFPAIPISSSLSPPVIDSNSILDQPTWLLPVTPRPGTVSGRTPPSATQTPGGESYLGLIRKLVKSSGIYAISSLASPLVTLLLAPYLTHILSRTAYGALAVLTTVVALVTGVTELGLGAAFTRMYSYDCKTRREQLDALSTLVLLLLLILTPITAIGVMTAPWLSTLVLGSTSYSGPVQVAAVLVLTQNLTVPGLVWLRVESRAVLFSTISIANLLITAGATIMLVGMQHMDIVGSLVANGLGDAIIIACTLPIIFWRAGFHLRLTMTKSMLAFGTPNVTNLISAWVLQLSDRYLLGHLASLSLAAGYSVAYSLGGALSAAIISPFSLAWWVLMYPIARREDGQRVFKLIFRGFSFVLLFAALGLSLFGSSVLDLLFPSSYHAQSPIIPIIALSIMFNGIFTVVNLGTSLKRKTWLTSLYFIFSALINVGLNIVLIPIYGTMGAALATLVAYIALALIAYIFNQRIYPVPFETGLFLVALGIGIAFYLVGDGLAQGQSIVMAWGIRIGALLLYGLCLSLLGWFPLIARRTHSFIYRHT